MKYEIHIHINIINFDKIAYLALYKISNWIPTELLFIYAKLSSSILYQNEQGCWKVIWKRWFLKYILDIFLINCECDKYLNK